MRKKRLKRVGVYPEVYSEFTFENPASDSGSIRVTAASGAISLVAVSPRPGANPEFPIGEGYRVKFPLTGVPGASAWLLAQFRALLIEDPMQDPREVTAVRARLHDGTDDFVWAAGAWSVVADADADWNTLGEVALGLVDWPVASDFGVVFELSTTDPRFTPFVSGYTLLYEIDIPSDFDDWLYNTLVAGMKEIRPEKDIQLRSDGTSSIAFTTIESKLETDWNFEAVVDVFDLTDDPYRKVSILDTFDSGTRLITLTTAPASGHVLLLRVTYVPLVAVTTDQDYFELANTPAILFERVDAVDRGEVSEDTFIMNEYVDPPLATVFPAPRHVNIEIDLVITAPLTTDAHRLADSVTKWLNDRRVLVSPTTGERATMRITDPMQSTAVQDRTGIRTSGVSFVLEDLYFFYRDSFTAGDGSPGSVFAYGVTSAQVVTVVGSTSVTTDVGG